MKVAILASGGKDSCYAHWWALMRGWEVEALVTTVVTGEDSLMFQIPGVEFAGLHARSCAIPWVRFEVSGQPEREVGELQTALATEMVHGGVLEKIDGLVSGALRSDYQRSRLELMCELLGLRSFSPLWHNDGSSHLENLVSEGFEVVIGSVSCDGLGPEWLGRTLEREALTELKALARRHRFNVDGEGGEFETVVIAAPHLRHRIEWEAETVWEGGRGHLVFSHIYLSA